VMETTRRASRGNELGFPRPSTMAYIAGRNDLGG
jgi:hypothetical protein